MVAVFCVCERIFVIMQGECVFQDLQEKIGTSQKGENLGIIERSLCFTFKGGESVP
jgi:hypothetical protein